MRCIVTGAAGFVGSSISDHLLESGHEVIGLDSFVDYYPRQIKENNLEKAKSYKSYQFIEGHLLTLDLEKLLPGVEVIFHQAAQAGVRASWGKSFSSYLEHNVLSTQRLLEVCKGDEIKKTLKRIVYASSSSVYGQAEALPTCETAVPQPVSPYGVTKLAAEHLMGLYSKQFAVPSTSLRYFTVYGPRQRPDMAFNRFISSAIKGDKITVYGDGEQTRDFTFISDIVRANILAAEATPENLYFNIGGGSRVSINQVLKIISDILGKNVKIDYQPVVPGDARHTGADTKLAATQLGYKPQVSLEEGLKQEVHWLQSQLGSVG